MKEWKRNAVIATVLLFVCAGIYLNWSYQQKTAATDLTQTLDAAALTTEEYEQTLLETAKDGLETSENHAENAQETFAGIRLSRQESRESAIEMLQETISYAEEDSDASSSASASLDSLVSSALQEAQIESMVVAKGYTDCVAYMSDDTISLAVASPESGLNEADVAVLADIVTSQTDYDLSSIRIIEVG